MRYFRPATAITFGVVIGILLGNAVATNAWFQKRISGRVQKSSATAEVGYKGPSLIAGDKIQESSQAGRGVVNERFEGVAGQEQRMSSAHISHTNTILNGNTLFIESKATLQNLNQQSNYIWYVQIFYPGSHDKPIYTEVYNKQVFTNNLNSKDTISFTNFIDLDMIPGHYVVEIALAQVPNLVDYSTLNNTDIIKPMQVATMRRKIKFNIK